jgi:hypothetical protein
VRVGIWVVEPPIGIEPMTYALREARDLTALALAAQMTRRIAPIALIALEFRGLRSTTRSTAQPSTVAGRRRTRAGLCDACSPGMNTGEGENKRPRTWPTFRCLSRVAMSGDDADSLFRWTSGPARARAAVDTVSVWRHGLHPCTGQRVQICGAPVCRWRVPELSRLRGLWENQHPM